MNKNHRRPPWGLLTLGTVVTWTLGLTGHPGWAVVSVAATLLGVTVTTLRSLAQDQVCHVCGRPARYARLGMCGACSDELRPVKR